MASFLPSYFQKRLLRYALSRLDFVETDELDLENLGITWGQRSVIELKDVGIQIKKVTTLLNIPTSISITRARIALLRLTIPADLYASGIVVEVGGIDVQVKLQDLGQAQTSTSTQTRPTYGLSKGSPADRPRMASPTPQDPGGRTGILTGKLRHGTVVDTAIPTSEDLAASFLETEPLQERQELENILQSQSQHLQESTISAAGDGTGAPGGFELPTFVANFFKGVADRLTVEIKNICLTLETNLPQVGTQETDAVRFMIKISEIVLNGVGIARELPQTLDGRRSITLHNADLILLSERELFSQMARSSANSSPRLSKSPTKISSTSSKSKESTFSDPRESSHDSDVNLTMSEMSMSLSKRSEDSSPDSSPAFASIAGLGLNAYESEPFGGQNMEDSSIIFPPPPTFTSRSSFSTSTGRRIDNQSNAEMLVRTGQLEPSMNDGVRKDGHSQDLAESKVFTHDEAESMYMSAISHDLANSHPANAMPGGWNWSEASERQIDSQSTPITTTRSETPQPRTREVTSRYDESPESETFHTPPNPTQMTEEETSPEPRQMAPVPEPLDPLYISKRILSLDKISLSFPTRIPAEDNVTVPDQQIPASVYPPSPRQPKRASFADDSVYSQFSSQLFATQDLGTSKQNRPVTRGFNQISARIRQLKAPSINIGILSAAIDLPIGKLLVRTFQEIKSLKLFSTSSPPPPASASSPSPVDLAIHHLSIDVCDAVPEVRDSLSRSRNLDSGICGDEELLLRTSITGVNFQISSDGSRARLQASISKISIGHKGRSVLSFAHNINVRSSISASTLAPNDDLLILVESDRTSSQTQVQTKALKLQLDLLQIDEVLSRSGGLSSLLDLGNSIASASTVRGGSPRMKTETIRRRNVRFEPTSRSSERALDIADSQGKINIRVAGLTIDLVGSKSSMQVRSSAVKIAYRREMLGLQIDWAELEGPVLLDRPRKGDIKLKISNTRVEYLNAPKEDDIERLISILSPSRDRDELEKDDDIIVDRLVEQRKKGGVLRLTIASLDVNAEGLQWQRHVSKLADELSRLSSVSKYLPEDDRPGILTLALVKKLHLKLTLDQNVGMMSLKADLAEGAHVSVPSLMAAHVTSLELLRNDDRIIGDVVSSLEPRLAMAPPMIMCRFIADEMEPTVRIKLFNMVVEYKVSTVAALLEMGNALQESADEVSDRPMSPDSSASSTSHAAPTRNPNPTRIALAIRDTAIALNPIHSSAKGLVLLTDTSFSYTPGQKGEIKAALDIKKASMLVCDDVTPAANTAKNADPKLFFDESIQVQELVKSGFVPVAFLSAASVSVKLSRQKETKAELTDVELKMGLLILETCADSTQTMIQILNDLTPQAPPSKVSKYRTEIVPIEDMLASFTGNAYVTEPGPDTGLQVMPGLEGMPEDDLSEVADEDDAEFMGRLWQSQSEREVDDEMSESYLDSELAQSTASAAVSIAPVGLTESVMSASDGGVIAHSMLDFRPDHFAHKSSVGGTAHRWDSKQNTYGLGNESTIQQSPLKVKVRDFHVIWHLFDGYDWQSTRERITRAVQDIEVKAAARRPRSSSRLSPKLEDDDESEIGDFLFNSIWIGVPANKDPRELAGAINREIDDMTSESGSYATTTTITTTPTRRQSGTRTRQKKLRLDRSKHHKMAFELKGIAVDFIAFPPSLGEVESSIDVRVKDLEIIDLVPTSTWKKFATYMHDAGEREVDTNMVHLEILNVKPVADLAASEIVMKLTVLPLRLHVDQDALDFMSRFFEFKDDKAPSSAPSAPPFLQRVEVNPIKLKLDFKPKRVDYAALRSGRTTEFMNFLVLDRADMVLRRVILYGVSGFDRMGIMLNNIWSPDVRRNQLPGVLASLAPIRSLVDVGSGIKDLVVVPMREYKKDGRIVRSIQKGALAFAKTTSKELVHLGAKLAIGTQTILQNTETMLGPATEVDERDDVDEDSKRQISLYADQPLGIVQGLRGAYASLERDLLLARDAIVAVPGEVMASGSATGAAKAVLRSSPTIILRPAIGASKAVGQTLLGAGNTLDRENVRRVSEKYKRH